MMKTIALSTLLFAISCGGPAAGPRLSPTPTRTDAVAPSPTAAAGSTFTMTVDREMVAFVADRDTLYATSTKEAPAPYESKVLRADSGTAHWSEVYAADARFMFETISSGRLAFIEYREPYQGGGASSQAVVVVDLTTGHKTEFGRSSLSTATYRGGGGAPRRPGSAIAIGPDRVAWTRLVEGSGGSVTGELVAARLDAPTATVTVASSAEFIAPLDVGAHRLVYVLGGKTMDEMRVYDFDSGTEKVVATATVGDTARVGAPGMDRAVVSGDWALWFDQPHADGTAGHAVNLATGAVRPLDPGAAGCGSPTAGSRYFAWYCSKSAAEIGTFSILDAKTLDPFSYLPPRVGANVIATGDGLLWSDAETGRTTVTFFVPR